MATRRRTDFPVGSFTNCFCPQKYRSLGSNIERKQIMALSLQSIESLIDLVEIKVSVMEIHNRDDARELEKLGATWSELITQLADRKSARERFSVVALDSQSRVADRAVA